MTFQTDVHDHLWMNSGTVIITDFPIQKHNTYKLINFIMLTEIRHIINTTTLTSTVSENI